MRLYKGFISKRFRKLFDPIVGNNPTALLIRSTAKKSWKVISLNIFSNLITAITEGATIGVIFLAIEVLTISDPASFDWSEKMLIGSWPLIINLFSSISSKSIYSFDSSKANFL